MAISSGDRPVEWLPHHFGLLAERLSCGMTILQACIAGEWLDENGVRCYDLPTPGKLYRQVVSDAHAMMLFRHAVETRVWSMADEIMAIADDSTNDWLVIEARGGGEMVAANSEHIQRSRLRIETRLKLMGKLMPHVFGDAPAPASAAVPGQRQISDEERARAVAAILRKGAERRVAEMAQLAGVERAGG